MIEGYSRIVQEEFDNSIETTRAALELYKNWLINHKYGNVTVEFREMPMYADSDYAVFVNLSFDHFLEVKCRRHEMAKYDKTKVPLRRHATAEHYKNAKNINTYFLCSWTDYVGIFDFRLHQASW